MNLHEYQAKKLFAQFSLPVLKHWVFSDISEIKNNIFDIQNSFPWVAKCQIKSGGRGKSGGVSIVSSLEDLISFSKRWLGNRLITYQTTELGEKVESILIEPAVKIIHEFYLSVSLDRDSSEIICITSANGGTNIENILSTSPNLIYKVTVDPLFGPHPYQGRILACKLGLTGIQIDQFTKIYIKIVKMFLTNDLILVEINPLVITNNDEMICLDAKVTVDQNALFRNSALFQIYSNNNKINNCHNSLYSIDQLKVNYVALDGNIGCMVNGAGLAMATMDLIKSLGGDPANFLDIGGDTNKKEIVSALQIILKNKKIKAIFVNIFGGIVCCDLVADGIIEAVSVSKIDIPIVTRLEGNNAVLGSNKLSKSNLNIIVVNNLTDAIKKVITLVQ